MEDKTNVRFYVVTGPYKTLENLRGLTGQSRDEAMSEAIRLYCEKYMKDYGLPKQPWQFDSQGKIVNQSS
jgi:hypothetical protein